MDLLREAAGRLRGDPRDEKLHRVLDRTFVRPAASADRVGPRPMEPVIPFRTTSAGRAASSSAARGPARISGSAYSPFAQPRWDAAA